MQTFEQKFKEDLKAFVSTLRQSFPNCQPSDWYIKTASIRQGDAIGDQYRVVVSNGKKMQSFVIRDCPKHLPQYLHEELQQLITRECENMGFRSIAPSGHLEFEVCITKFYDRWLETAKQSINHFKSDSFNRFYEPDDLVQDCLVLLTGGSDKAEGCLANKLDLIIMQKAWELVHKVEFKAQNNSPEVCNTVPPHRELAQRLEGSDLDKEKLDILVSLSKRDMTEAEQQMLDGVIAYHHKQISASQSWPSTAYRIPTSVDIKREGNVSYNQLTQEQLSRMAQKLEKQAALLAEKDSDYQTIADYISGLVRCKSADGRGYFLR